MKIAVMQPYFFPYIGYWQLINAVDKFVIFDDVNYINRGWINRNKILNTDGSQYFNILLKSRSQNKKINETELNNDARYIKKNLKKISFIYGKAPYYSMVYPVLEQILTNRELNLSKYLYFNIECICDYLNITTELLLSSEISNTDNRTGQDRIINIVKKCNADTYINAIGGADLYSRYFFQENKINLFFLKTNNIEYKQFNNIFVPNLSIIDVMMFNSVDEIKSLLNRYELL